MEVDRAPVEPGRQKTASAVGKLRFFRGLASSPARSINLCGNFRQEPNAERSGYYISPVEVGEGVVYPSARHHGDAYDRFLFAA